MLCEGLGAAPTTADDGSTWSLLRGSPAITAAGLSPASPTQRARRAPDLQKKAGERFASGHTINSCKASDLRGRQQQWMTEPPLRFCQGGGSFLPKGMVPLVLGERAPNTPRMLTVRQKGVRMEASKPRRAIEG